ncbi:MAG: pyrroline-5-carboxylate reductase [Candidatus Omnitrophota bacterium]|nr:MAG: pyrroline-5-carboxylate reductase [Candidatus Omnitrophota bacterium]
MKKAYKIGVIGLGNMGSSIGDALAGRRGCKVYVYDKERRKTKRTKGFYRCSSSKELIQSVDVVILAVKPQDIKEFIGKTKEYFLTSRPLLVTIAAGVSTNFFENRIPGVRVIRVMPNLAARVRQSVSFICKGKFANQRDVTTAKEVFSSVGEVFFTKESFLDKVTSLSGSGPGYVYYFMDCLYESACALGFSKAIAQKMVIQTFYGAINLIKSQPDDFKVWIGRVASKGGTTQAALNVWEKNNFPQLFRKAVSVACRRAKELNLKGG